MVKSIGTTNNYLLELIKKKRHQKVSMYTIRVYLAKSEQVFRCCIQLNSFNGTDLSWALRVERKSFIQNDSDIFLFHLLFLKFLAMILKFSWATWPWYFSMLFFEHVRLVISSIVVFNTFLYTTCSFTDMIVFTCWYMTVHMIYQVVLVN